MTAKGFFVNRGSSYAVLKTLAAFALLKALSLFGLMGTLDLEDNVR